MMIMMNLQGQLVIAIQYDETPGPSGECQGEHQDEQIGMETFDKLEHIKNELAKLKGEDKTGNAEKYFIEGDTYSRVLLATEDAWEALERIYPDSKATELEASYSKKGKLQVKMFGKGKTIYTLYTTDKKTGEQNLNPNLTKEIRKALRSTREELILQKDLDIEELNKSILEDERIVEDDNGDSAERERARERITEKRQQISDLEN